VIVVPRGNSVEKKAAMRALGAQLIEHGDDFQQSREYAAGLAAERGLHFVPAYHRDLVSGVATYWLEFCSAVQPDVAFVPKGSGICACAAARRAAGAGTRIVGVVSAQASAYCDSSAARRPPAAPVSTRLADGMACRVADEEPLAVILDGVDEVLAVTDDEIAQAMRALFADTHNVAEGAGAAALAAALQKRERWRCKPIGLLLTGGNVDTDVFARVLSGQTP
jgi:threonine dehydratase